MREDFCGSMQSSAHARVDNNVRVTVLMDSKQRRRSAATLSCDEPSHEPHENLAADMFELVAQ